MSNITDDDTGITAQDVADELDINTLQLMAELGTDDAFLQELLEYDPC